MWQLDFTEYETRHGGTWRIAGVSDYWSKLELGWHVSTTANHRDAIETVELAICETERLLGRPLAEILADPETGEMRPIALVSDNGPAFKAARFAAFVAKRPELIHIRTRRKSPNQNGVRERAFGSLKYEHLYRLEIDDGFDLGREVEAYRHVFNTSGHTKHSTGSDRSSTSKPVTMPRPSSQTSPNSCHFREAGHYGAWRIRRRWSSRLCLRSVKVRATTQTACR